LGRRIGYERFKPLVDRHGRWAAIEWEDVEKLHGFFRRHGQWIVFVFRFMPAFRTIVSLPAGMARMNRWKFLVWTGGGAAIWNLSLIH
ncbi:DedA family protein, partial [Salmonella enterica]|uniref:DedA family protein n=1 Tax=Salmonella enterica TaxID=28901 RepID=UPI000CB807ED